ncbi:LysE/ArgO family amino acid transporter [Photobacterium angustum]|uniref:LysE/ArgO family amino acid transporter n=1 Tax=Photobacterium angustum TaxID=661 RepID=UPI0005DF7FAC|nr:LysE/ArgO family amino acid transporter [Photobacterium angustum]KJF98721.1 amino acid transporter [Photobacterium angustum]PSV63860.1 amino acid transporter [Photobacterium angustum]
MTTFLAGFSLGLSLILAIGSQNAFVLKQGLKNQYVFIICIVCALSDALLISLGVAGFGVIVSKYPDIETVARYGGAIFLTVYGLLSFKSALMTDHALLTDKKTSGSLLKTVLTCLAFTWLNPHVYLDTVVLLGSISSQYQPHVWQFGLGTITASFVFFFSLGYGSRLLAPLFQQPKAWKVLEILVGVIMLSIAASLVLGI